MMASRNEQSEPVQAPSLLSAVVVTAKVAAVACPITATSKIATGKA
jgi:hypothetical protein